MPVSVQQSHPIAHLPLVLDVLRRLEVATVVDSLIPPHPAHGLSGGRGVEAVGSRSATRGSQGSRSERLPGRRAAGRTGSTERSAAEPRSLSSCRAGRSARPPPTGTPPR